ncbi:hypothetical protein N2152v2_007121 [Parachlorella kessleri]
MKSFAIVLCAMALFMATTVRADDIDDALELGGACSGDWSGVYLLDVRNFEVAKDAALRAAQYLLDVKPDTFVCPTTDDDQDEDALDERFDDVDFRYVCQKNVSTGTYYKREWLQRLNIAWSHAGIGFAVGADMSFSIDCDESNSEETDSQALYLEALFFKPTSGKIQFLNVTTAQALDCSDINDSGLVCYFGKYTLACDTFWSGTSTANLTCSLSDKSGSKQTLKLSCDISSSTPLKDLVSCLTSSSDWSSLSSTVQTTITNLLEKFKTAMDSGALATMSYSSRK